MEIKPRRAERLASEPAAASPRSTSSVATAAPLEKSTIEWAEAKRSFRVSLERVMVALGWVQVCGG